VSKLVDGFCGRANLLQELPTQNTDDQAFGVVGAGCLSNSTYLHEIGHNMGAAHDDANLGGFTGVHPYSRGWVDVANNFVTVMSYANGGNGCSGCTTISQFSSTTELFGGFATGDIDHTNASTLEATRIGIAAYRPDPCPNPINDDFPARIDLGSSSLTSTSGTNVCASIEDLETYFIGDEPVESVWYEWTAPFAGTARFSTCDAATTFDTTITIFDDHEFFSALSVVAHNDDAGAACTINPSHSEALATVTTGQLLRFKVDGDGAATGTFALTVTVDTTCNGQSATVYVDRGDVATSGDDVIIGTSNADAINALDGNDIVCGLAGDDVINSGPGDDQVFGGGGNDTIYGVAGNDIINGDAGQDTLLGFAGNDTLNGGDDNDTLNGGPGDDVIDGGAGDDSIFGQGGDDTLNGGPGMDLMIGLDGVDTMNGDAGMDTINGGSGADFLSGGDDGDIIFGITGNDTINGDGGVDFLFGQVGNDIIDGGAGADNIWGNENDDTITDPSGANVINGGSGNDNITGGVDADQIFGEGNVGQLGNDTIDGGLGPDLLLGLGGDDTIIANDGFADTVNGGPTLNDTCFVDAVVDTVFNCELP
jgi:Ca2+-binding RTX toxin-like protein